MRATLISGHQFSVCLLPASAFVCHQTWHSSPCITFVLAVRLFSPHVSPISNCLACPAAPPTVHSFANLPQTWTQSAGTTSGASSTSTWSSHNAVHPYRAHPSHQHIYWCIIWPIPQYTTLSLQCVTGTCAHAMCPTGCTSLRPQHHSSRIFGSISTCTILEPSQCPHHTT